MAPLEVAKNDQGLILLTHPRSASNLFQKMLSEQPSVYRSGYNFYDAALAAFAQIRRGRLSDLSEADREAIFQPYKASYESMCKEIETAGKQVTDYCSFHVCQIIVGANVIRRNRGCSSTSTLYSFSVPTSSLPTSTPPTLHLIPPPNSKLGSARTHRSRPRLRLRLRLRIRTFPCRIRIQPASLTQRSSLSDPSSRSAAPF